MSEALKTNTTLVTLRLASVQKQGKFKQKDLINREDNFTDNAIGTEGTRALIEALKVNTTLKDLNLAGEQRPEKFQERTTTSIKRQKQSTSSAMKECVQ